MIDYISELDTKRFGFKIAKVRNWSSDPERVIKELKELDAKLIFTQVDSHEINRINLLEDLGFRLKDTQVIYRYDIRQLDFSEEECPSGVVIREAASDDVSELVSIGEEAFSGYGHYFADKRLDRKQCIEVYKDWTRRSCEERAVADKVFVAEVNNSIAGYLTFKIHSHGEIRYAAGGLGAVSRKFRNKNIFPTLAKKGLLWGAEIGLEWEQHNALTTNYPVNRSFSKIGFKVSGSFCTLHCWLDD
jgi:hypothetical protein